MQGKKSNYETDLFQPIIKAIEEETKINGYSLDSIDKNIIADHIRAIVFGINDGVMPSNEGRGYVIKRLIIDATGKMIPIGRTGTRLYKLVPTVVEMMKDPYRELLNKGKADNITDIIKRIQESYSHNSRRKNPRNDF